MLQNAEKHDLNLKAHKFWTHITALQRPATVKILTWCENKIWHVIVQKQSADSEGTGWDIFKLDDRNNESKLFHNNA